MNLRSKKNLKAEHKAVEFFFHVQNKTFAW